MFCPKCGKAVPEGAQFCMACGAPIPTGNGPSSGTAATTTAAPLAPTGASEFKCPSCGAPVRVVLHALTPAGKSRWFRNGEARSHPTALS